jgi:hypothetical protein
MDAALQQEGKRSSAATGDLTISRDLPFARSAGAAPRVQPSRRSVSAKPRPATASRSRTVRTASPRAVFVVGKDGGEASVCEGRSEPNYDAALAAAKSAAS